LVGQENISVKNLDRIYNGVTDGHLSEDLVEAVLRAIAYGENLSEELANKLLNYSPSIASIIAKRYSKTVEDSYMANVCEHCNAFIGEFYMHDYYYSQPDKEKELSYICFHCNDM
jgi:hypothetical protein